MKRLACIVGRHNWATVTGQGQSYRVCSECGKIPKLSGLDGFSADDRRAKDMGRSY